MESAFARMLRGEEPCVFVVQDTDHAAILESCPASSGHVVVFPKKISDALFELAPDELTRLMAFAREVAHALRRAVPCDKIALLSYGLKVRHVHLHLIPVSGVPGEISLDKPRPAAATADLERLAGKIRPHFRPLM